MPGVLVAMSESCRSCKKRLWCEVHRLSGAKRRVRGVWGERRGVFFLPHTSWRGEIGPLPSQVGVREDGGSQIESVVVCVSTG